MNGISSLETSENVALISFKKIPDDLAFLSGIFERFSSEGIVIDMISQTSPISGNVSISFSCLEKDMVKILKITNELSSRQPQIKPMVSSGNCKLRLSGEEMREASGVFAKVLSCLSKTSAELLQITTSETEISLLVPSAHLEDTVNALTGEFSL